MRVRSAEYAPRNYQHAVPNRLGDELRPRPPGSLREEIERPPGQLELERPAKAFCQQVALPLVVRDERGRIVVQGRKPAPLYDARGADERELLKFGDLLNQPPGAVRPAEPPAGHAIGLAEALDDQHVLVVTGWRIGRSLVVKCPVNLVAD